MTRPSVLMIGADPYVLRACEAHDVETVLLCNSGAYDSGRIHMPPGGTIIRVDDVTNVEDLVGGLHRAGMGGRSFDAVQTTWEFSVVTAAVLARTMGTRGIAPETALHFRDKSLQKSRLAAAGVPVARTEVVHDLYDVSTVEFAFERAVLKPIAGGGTTSTSVVRDRAELEKLSRECREKKETARTFLLEEFVEGDEWMAEGVVHDGEILFFGLGAYTEPCLAAVDGQEPLSLRRLDPTTDADAYAATEPVVRDAIAALGLRDSVFHMELFREKETGRIVFSECAARRGGALTQEQVLAKFNVDLGEAALLCALGRRPRLDVKVHPGTVGCAGLYGPPGTIVDYPDTDALMALPDVAFVQLWVPPGATLSSKFSASADMLGAVLLVSDSVEEFDRRVTETRQWFANRLAVADPALTGGQRWAWVRRQWPDRNYSDSLFPPA
ncbi:ATP-grasp domain-containing protein [Micromonospora craniellae]|uniref:ATP-grasp domain-containing protein n=1 Tax=Micromonospora craniellae TaxID=2294034 RepID=A0A372FTE3_9ACTN|nr:ATP-grasp domain-containing protein [Micromonospora craniellae]QOC93949.1 ATP-grasp domain-containing protein [Micromonospora craniellae]RFS44015.1 ATP-grasp domain-containing protein [Micromonospora craniellae]